MAGPGIFRAILIAIVALYVFSYSGNCVSNAEKAERIKAPATDPPRTEKGERIKAPATDPKRNSQSIRVDLIRRDSLLSNAEQLRRAVERSHNRLRRFQQYFITKNAQISHNPLSAGDGLFSMQVKIGSPNPVTLHLIVDTGSDLIWTKCQASSLYKPGQSSSYSKTSCGSNVCLAVGNRCDAQKICVYRYGYTDTSYSSGTLAYETFMLSSQARATSFQRIAFGCGHDQGKSFARSDGIVGLGGGPLSLVSQIGSSINNVFSYCLGSLYNSSGTSPLFLGSTNFFEAGKFSVTPIIPNKNFPTFHYLSLEGISVAGKAIPYPKGTFEIQPGGRGGIFIDSGSTITYLAEAAYRPLLAAVRSSIKTPPVQVSRTSFDLCYDATFDNIRIPAITFLFGGGANYVLSPQNSFLSYKEYTRGLLCFAFVSAGPAGSTSIFGNVQQQNFHIVYDLKQQKLHFAPANCASL